jgi:hypothetical protein
MERGRYDGSHDGPSAPEDRSCIQTPFRLKFPLAKKQIEATIPLLTSAKAEQ